MYASPEREAYADLCLTFFASSLFRELTSCQKILPTSLSIAISGYEIVKWRLDTDSQPGYCRAQVE